MQPIEIANTLEFPDNGGRRRLLLRRRDALETEIVADVTIRHDSVDGPNSAELSLVAMPLSRERLAQLNHFLLRWICDFSSFRIELAHVAWWSLEVTVGSNVNYITSTEKPAVQVDVHWNGISATAIMVVDQSCVRIFQEGLAAWLQTTDSPNPSRIE